LKQGLLVIFATPAAAGIHGCVKHRWLSLARKTRTSEYFCYYFGVGSHNTSDQPLIEHKRP
jgi:hypothetical protein